MYNCPVTHEPCPYASHIEELYSSAPGADVVKGVDAALDGVKKQTRLAELALAATAINCSGASEPDFSCPTAERMRASAPRRGLVNFLRKII